ncbi:unnamed protein product, partial [Notodromas monacha]
MSKDPENVYSARIYALSASISNHYGLHAHRIKEAFVQSILQTKLELPKQLRNTKRRKAFAFMAVICLIGISLCLRSSDHDYNYSSHLEKGSIDTNEACPGFTIDGEAVCLNKNVTLIILILSNYKEVFIRNQIRETWKHSAESHPEIKSAFLLGKPEDQQWHYWIENEHTIFGDLIIGNFPDYPDYPAIKIDSALEWAATYCPQAKLLMEVPDHLRRKAIRETWASEATDQVKVAFLTGKAEDPVVDFQLQQEHRIHQDIIKVNFLDVYTSLSLKSASMLNWVHTFCKNAQFAIKVDEDMMVNVKRMSSYFQAQENASKTIYCRVKPAGNKIRAFMFADLHRDRKSKYFVPSSMYPNDVYPEYCAGPAYAITSDAITELWHQVMDEQFVWMEDFLITGLAAGNLGLRLVDNDDFVAQSPKNPRREEVLNYLVYYGRSHECMRLLWNEHVKAERRGFLRKDAIRETWATQANGSGVAYAFLIGNPNDEYLNEKLLKEHQRNEDLIQSNSYDSYATLTIKSLTLLQWVSTFCKHAKFVLKVDDDVMVNIQNILDFLRVHATATRMIFCTVRPMGQRVIRDNLKAFESPNSESLKISEIFEIKIRRDPTSKYNMPKWMFPEDKLPAYCRGGAYVLTADSISPLWHQVRQEQFILLEDLLVTGIAAPKCGIQKKHNLNFVPPKSKDDGRKEIEGFFSYYAQSPENMKLLWKVRQHDLHQPLLHSTKVEGDPADQEMNSVTTQTPQNRAKEERKKLVTQGPKRMEAFQKSPRDISLHFLKTNRAHKAFTTSVKTRISRIFLHIFKILFGEISSHKKPHLVDTLLAESTQIISITLYPFRREILGNHLARLKIVSCPEDESRGRRKSAARRGGEHYQGHREIRAPQSTSFLLDTFTLHLLSILGRHVPKLMNASDSTM